MKAMSVPHVAYSIPMPLCGFLCLSLVPTQYLAPMTDSPGGSNKAGLALVGTPNHDLTMSFKSSGGPCTGIPEPGGTTRESLMGGQALTRQNGQRCFREGRHSSHGEGVYDRETKAKSVCSETETVLEVGVEKARMSYATTQAYGHR